MASEYDSYPEQNENLTAKLTKHRAVSRFSIFERILGSFSPGDRFILYVLVGLFIVSALALLVGANAAVSVEVPARGGSLTEGVVGPARFLNPLLAISGPDKDLATLVYSGLMRATPEGDIVPDLARTYEISGDGTVYTFTLRDGLTFHDGKPLTSQDVMFTVQRAQDPDIKSVRRADWDGVSIATPNDRTVVFTLPHAYAPFLENTTLGILPRHLWDTVSTDEFPFDPLNIHPIGSGPYEIKSVSTNSTGAAIHYELSSFASFALGEPHIPKISVLFFPNEDALVDAFNTRRIDSIAGLSPSQVEKLTRKDAYIVHVPLPRTFGVFFNQNKNTVLADAAVRSALAVSVDKANIVDDILHGYGAVLDGPIPPGVLGNVQPATPVLLEKNSLENAGSMHGDIEEARSILEKDGWKFDEGVGVWMKKDVKLQLTLATVDEPTLSETAQKVTEAWQTLGVAVETHIYPLSELNNIVLRPRNYEAVLFGEVVGRTLDLFAFWHSSQRNDPGLNLALYTNAKADALLAQARAATGKSERERLYEKFADIVIEDQPAVFLYAPEFIYIVPQELKGVELGALTLPAERYLNVYDWYTDTERVWDIFTDKTQE